MLKFDIDGTVCVDFDGVIHDNASESGKPVDGAFAFLETLVQAFPEVCIFSCRNWDPDGIDGMQEWFRKHGLSERVLMQLKFPLNKPPALIYIDDRAFQFNGTFPSVEYLKSFEPWNVNSQDKKR